MEKVCSGQLSQASLFQVLDHVDRAIVLLDAGRRVVYHNRLYQKLWGLPSEFLRQKPRIEECIRWACQNGVYPQEQKETLISRRLEHLATGAPCVRLDTPRLDGITVEGYASPLSEGGWVLSFQDTTHCQRMLLERQAREAQYRTILDALPDFVLICSPSCTINYMNAALTRYLGGDATGSKCHGSLSNIKLACHYCQLNNKNPRDTTTTSEITISSDGKRTYHVLYVPLQDRGYTKPPSTATLVILRDVTEQAVRHRQLHRQLEDLLRLQREILESAGEGSFVTDENLVLQIWNPVMERCSRVAANDALGRPLGEVLGPEGETLVGLAKQALGGERVTATFEHCAPRHAHVQAWFSGTFIPRLDHRGNIKGVVGLVRDVTQQKLNEDAKEKKDLIFRTLVEHTHAVPWEFDLRSRKFTYVGPQAAEITGYSPETWTDASSWRERVHPEDRDRVLAHLRQTLREGTRTSLEYRLVKNDGTVIWALTLLAVFHSTDRSKRLLGFLIDVTEKKREEQERRHFEDRLQQAERMETLGILAGGVAHDFKNLLTPILAQAGILECRLPSGSRLRHNAREITKAAERAADLAEQILKFSRETSGEKRAVVLAPIVKETVMFMQSGLPSSIVWRQHFQIGDEQISSDPTKIHQIVMNLCMNAAQAMEGTGTLEIGLVTLPASSLPEFSEPPHPASRYARLWVRDTGPGIPQELVPRIFEPFFTTKKDKGGTGMGLANVQRIVRELGGGVSVRTEEGKGAQFDIYLPLLEKNANMEGKGPLGRPEFRRGSERILLVDDERAIVDLLTHILSDLGYRVSGAENGPRAIEIFKRGPDDIDVLLVDLLMPEMNGLDVIRKARSIREDLPVILCSGQPMAARKLQHRGVQAPAVVLSKPFSVADLSEALRKVLDE